MHGPVRYKPACFSLSDKKSRNQMRLFRISRMNIYQNPHHIIMPLASSARKEVHSQSTAEKLKKFDGHFMQNSLRRFIFM